jgi:hypothetical protein
LLGARLQPCELAVFSLPLGSAVSASHLRSCFVLSQHVLPQALLFEAALAVLASVHGEGNLVRRAFNHLVLPSPVVVTPQMVLKLVMRQSGAIEVRGRGGCVKNPYAVHFIAGVTSVVGGAAVSCQRGDLFAARAFARGRAACRNVVAMYTALPVTNESSGYTISPAQLESALQTSNFASACAAGAASFAAPVLMVSAVRCFSATSAGASGQTGMRVSARLPRGVHAAAGHTKRWASERVAALGQRACAVEMSGLVACQLSDQWRCVRNGAVGRIITRAPSSDELVSTHVASDSALEDLAGVLKACIDSTIGRSVGLDDPLAEMGIDSITWVEVRNSVQHAVGQEMDVSEFVEAFTLATLAQQLQHVLDKAAAEPWTDVVAGAPLAPSTAWPTAPGAVLETAAASDEGVLTRTLRPSVEVAFSPQPLFLGAPAFGDGSLAYMSLTKALEAELRAWNQPIITLERDTETLWPTLAATHAQHMAALQPEGAYVLGGHSLGGLLAFETAVCLERARSTVGAVFLLDSSHPQQFKVEWMDEAFDPLDVAMTHDEKQHALKQLTIMMKALNFNFDEVRWEGLKTEEKFKVFEDLSFQARS